MRQRCGGGLQPVGRHVVGGGVDQVAGQRLAGRNRLDPGGIDPFGGHEADLFPGFFLIGVKAVAGEKPTKKLGLDITWILWQPAFDVIGARWQALRHSGKGKATAGPVLGRSDTAQRGLGRAVLTRKQQHLPRPGHKAIGFGPATRARLLGQAPAVKGLGGEQGKRDRCLIGIGEYQGMVLRHDGYSGGMDFAAA